MKRINISIVFILILFISCKRNVTNQSTETDNTLRFLPLEKLFVVGNFYGNGTIDTIFQHSYSLVSKTEIDSVPDYFEEIETYGMENWFKLHDWFREQEIKTFLTLKTDTLYFNLDYPSYGLFCLLNIGDVNNDGKDEIAFVVDWFDVSNLNRCEIYTICNHQWILLKEFQIHENAFTYEGDIKLFTEIEGYLEKRDGKWFFLDFIEYMETDDDVMKPLKLSKCQDKNK